MGEASTARSTPAVSPCLMDQCIRRSPASSDSFKSGCRKPILCLALQVGDSRHYKGSKSFRVAEIGARPKLWAENIFRRFF
jgi:hypothetical protein